MPEPKERKRQAPGPGVCIPWAERVREYARVMGDEEVVRKVWEEVDTLAYLYIWACLIQF